MSIILDCIPCVPFVMLTIIGIFENYVWETSGLIIQEQPMYGANSAKFNNVCPLCKETDFGSNFLFP